MLLAESPDFYQFVVKLYTQGDLEATGVLLRHRITPARHLLPDTFS